MKVIFLCGYSGTGKDTFYTSLSEGELDKYFIQILESTEKKFVFPEKIVRHSFADPIKDFTKERWSDILKIDDELWNKKDDEIMAGVTPRNLYIAEGQMRRYPDPLIWTKIAFEKCKLSYLQGYTPIITDYRNPEELDFFKEQDCDVTVIRLYRSKVKMKNVYMEGLLDNQPPDLLFIGTDTSLDDVPDLLLTQSKNVM